MKLRELEILYKNMEKDLSDIRRSLWLRQKKTRNI